MVGGVGKMESTGENAPESAFGAEVCPADFEVQQDRDLMSVDLTHAWPVKVGARSIQRTAMALRREAALRVVDAFDLEKPAPITFRFITPQQPQLIKPDAMTVAGARLGPVEMNWEGEMSCAVSTLSARFPTGDAPGKPLYSVILTTPRPVGRGFFTFYFALGQ